MSKQLIAVFDKAMNCYGEDLHAVHARSCRRGKMFSKGAGLSGPVLLPENVAELTINAPMRFVGRIDMKFLISAALTFLFVTAAAAQPNGEQVKIAQAANACLSTCASQDAACRRSCPATLNGPCLSSCDAQTRSCRQGCGAR